MQYEYIYSDPTRENDPHTPPDVEVFEVSTIGALRILKADFGISYEPGWYWWPHFPGYLPNGEPRGPFATEAEAVQDARYAWGGVAL